MGRWVFQCVAQCRLHLNGTFVGLETCDVSVIELFLNTTILLVTFLFDVSFIEFVFVSFFTLMLHKIISFQCVKSEQM